MRAQDTGAAARAAAIRAERRASEIETRTRRAIVTRVVHTLQVLVAQIQGLELEIAQALDAHPDGEIFRSFFKTDSVICAATLLAEIGDCRRRYPHRDAIAADAGQVSERLRTAEPAAFGRRG